jgi:hypothetical protein
MFSIRTLYCTPNVHCVLHTVLHLYHPILSYTHIISHSYMSPYSIISSLLNIGHCYTSTPFQIFICFYKDCSLYTVHCIYPAAPSMFCLPYIILTLPNVILPCFAYKLTGPASFCARISYPLHFSIILPSANPPPHIYISPCSVDPRQLEGGSRCCSGGG